MVKNSWPTGVSSWADTVKFAQLLFGSDVQFGNYSHRLPHNSNESFLLFAKGACKEPRPFSCIRELIAGQLEEIKEYEADEKIRAWMEVPTLWECLEVFNLQKELAISKYLIPSDADCMRRLGWVPVKEIPSFSGTLLCWNFPFQEPSFSGILQKKFQ